MALSPYTAQCPQCQYEIDLTENDMKIAQGDIICGNCNTQFHAPDYLLKGFYSSSKKTANKVHKVDTREHNPQRISNDIMNTTDFDVAPGYYAYRRRKFIKNFFAALVNLLLLGFLLFQLLWINFESWAAKESIRPVYGFLCSIKQLNCRLPYYIEPVNIKAENFQVNLRDDGIYILQAALTNYASTSKSFPWIEVIFSDINEYPIASGRFSPYQYLDKDVASSLMPAGKSFDILLEINPPSSPVAKYELNVIAVN